MSQVIAILGAGRGLAASVAHQYAAQGYKVALVARSGEKLTTLARDIASDGAEVATIVADLSRADGAETAIQAVRERFGSIDVLYYAPSPLELFIPAADLTPDLLRPKIDLFLFGLIAAVNAVLPEFRARGEGVILSAFGGSAQVGFPHMSGVGPAIAGARNYLQSLQKELVPENIQVGVVTITAVIRNSAFHQSLQAEGGQPSGLSIDVPEADPDHLAALLAQAAADPDRLEAVFPPA